MTYSLIVLCLFIISCDGDNSTALGESNDTAECTNPISIDDGLGACSETLPYTPSFSNVENSNDTRTITSNNIPNHLVGLFGGGPGSLNPNQITPQNNNYIIDLTPSIANEVTFLLGDAGIDYSFGILLNGIEVDPIAAEPWPHEGTDSPNVNWEWNLEASMAGLGIDCNRAHVQPFGAYHYHGTPSLYLENLGSNLSSKTLIGYAADGFPIYHEPTKTSSYQIKSGSRPGDGISAPCGNYDGLYTADYEYIDGLGDLGVCNEYYDGNEYYYVLTNNYPGIPRCFIGTPSNDFKIGPEN